MQAFRLVEKGEGGGGRGREGEGGGGRGREGEGEGGREGGWWGPVVERSTFFFSLNELSRPHGARFGFWAALLYLKNGIFPTILFSRALKLSSFNSYRV